MNKTSKLFTILLISIFILNIISVSSVSACKDIIAVGDATEGEYNLLMKVRDPSRPDYQVLCIVPEGYEYTYPHPKTGKDLSFTTEEKYIGGVSAEDIIPNIVKPGMALSDAGIAYGDSDTNSRWVNLRKHAWDDFDWIRYACEKANNEQEAIDLLTKEAVDELHAPGVSENLFVVGPDKGYVIEADAYRYKIEEVENGVTVRHNYPKLLWKSQILKTLPISRSFETVVEKQVRKRGVVRLGSIYGVRITDIDENSITVSPVGFSHILKTNSLRMVTKINVSERKSVGYFSVQLLGISKNKANVRVTNIYYAWEEELLKHMSSRKGSITPENMMQWSRLTSEDLDGLRGLNQDENQYENVVIYKIPKTNYETLSMGWFAPNHARSSIFVPFHISNTEIYEKYTTPAAAELSYNLLTLYDDDTLEQSFEDVEDVFIREIENAEEISIDLIRSNEDFIKFLTIIDISMQRQAYKTQILWQEAHGRDDIHNCLNDIWRGNYRSSLNAMKSSIIDLERKQNTDWFIEQIKELSLDIVDSKIKAVNALDKDLSYAKEKYNESIGYFKKGFESKAYNSLLNAYESANRAVNDEYIDYNYRDYEDHSYSSSSGFPLIFVGILFLSIFVIIAILIINIKKFRR
jgi:hypothetical protein